MLISYINREQYSNDDPLDEVTLCILASNVGVKSAVEHSMAQLKKLQKEIDNCNIVDIIGAIKLSNKVDDALDKWLEDTLDKSCCRRHDKWFEEVMDLQDYHDKIHKPHPSVHQKLCVNLGFMLKPKDRLSRTL